VTSTPPAQAHLSQPDMSLSLPAGLATPVALEPKSKTQNPKP